MLTQTLFKFRRFHLGALETGRYRVMHHDTLVAEFVVQHSPQKLVVNVTPQNPLVGDTVDVEYIIDTASSSCVPRFLTTVELKGTLSKVVLAKVLAGAIMCFCWHYG
jgi:hypothetical protein